ncbi:MAG: hypothetical protein ACI9K2_004689 [Myxococcota bacterium]|jgi:hypothetical protein
MNHRTIGVCLALIACGGPGPTGQVTPAEEPAHGQNPVPSSTAPTDGVLPPTLTLASWAPSVCDVPISCSNHAYFTAYDDSWRHSENVAHADVTYRSHNSVDLEGYVCTPDLGELANALVTTAANAIDEYPNFEINAANYGNGTCEGGTFRMTPQTSFIRNNQVVDQHLALWPFSEGSKLGTMMTALQDADKDAMEAIFVYTVITNPAGEVLQLLLHDDNESMAAGNLSELASSMTTGFQNAAEQEAMTDIAVTAAIEDFNPFEALIGAYKLAFDTLVLSEVKYVIEAIDKTESMLKDHDVHLSWNSYQWGRVLTGYGSIERTEHPWNLIMDNPGSSAVTASLVVDGGIACAVAGKATSLATSPPAPPSGSVTGTPQTTVNAGAALVFKRPTDKLWHYTNAVGACNGVAGTLCYTSTSKLEWASGTSWRFVSDKSPFTPLSETAVVTDDMVENNTPIPSTAPVQNVTVTLVNYTTTAGNLAYTYYNTGISYNGTDIAPANLNNTVIRPTTHGKRVTVPAGDGITPGTATFTVPRGVSAMWLEDNNSAAISQLVMPSPQMYDGYSLDFGFADANCPRGKHFLAVMTLKGSGAISEGTKDAEIDVDSMIWGGTIQSGRLYDLVDRARNVKIPGGASPTPEYALVPTVKWTFPNVTNANAKCLTEPTCD